VPANEDRKNDVNDEGTAQASEREPYTPPVIEKFPPMGDVTFGTNVQPLTAMTLAGA
jgi:hypothetical protein